MTREQKIEICRNLLADNKNRFARVEFLKKDGTLRKMSLHKSKKLEATVNGAFNKLNKADIDIFFRKYPCTSVQ